MTKKKTAAAVEPAPEDGQLFIQVQHIGHPTEGDTITAKLSGASFQIQWTDPNHAGVLMSQIEAIIDQVLTQAHLQDEAAAVDSDAAV